MELIITNLEDFAMHVNNNLESVGWGKKRDIIRTLVKRIEIGKEEVNVVFKINTVNPEEANTNHNKLVETMSMNHTI